ncbi:MAG: RDD family protein [Treponema sp.]|nr:RDD family protein [Treponema sp.]
MVPAGLPVRTLAYVIDVVFKWIIIIGIYFIWEHFFSWRFGIWIFLILNFCLDWFYHVICELAFSGRSLGKRMAGIRVVKSDGSPVDPSASFIRNLLRFADTFCYLFHIALLSMTISSGFRRIGDWAGNTVVVYTQSGSFHKNTINFLSGYTPIVPPFSLSYDEKQAVLNFARRYPLLGESRANEIAGIYAPYLRNQTSKLTNAEYLLGIASHLSGGVSISRGKAP